MIPDQKSKITEHTDEIKELFDRLSAHLMEPNKPFDKAKMYVEVTKLLEKLTP